MNQDFLNIVWKPEQERLARAILPHYKRRDEPFKLNCGAESQDYFDLKQGQCAPYLIGQVTNMVYLLLKQQGHIKELDKTTSIVFAGMESGAFPLLGGMQALGYHTNMLMVRKKPKGHGTNTQVEGLGNLSEPYNNYKVWVLEDVTTTGSSSLQVCHILRKLGFGIAGLVTILDRQDIIPIEAEQQVRDTFAAKGLSFGEWPTGPFAETIFAQHSIPFYPLLNRSEFLQYNDLDD